jgi:hypothetical protein
VERLSGWQYCSINEKKEKRRQVPLYQLKTSRKIEAAGAV